MLIWCNMTKDRMNISLDPELLADLRQRSLTKYGNLKSVSRLIEEMLYASIRSEKNEKL